MLARYRFRGFTLVELLVVFAVVGLLMALLMPAVQSIRSNVRSKSCQNNLHQMGEAFQISLTRGDLAAALTDKATKQVNVANWTSVVLPDLGGQEAVLGCPELETSASGYGINNLAHLFGKGDGRKILVLDFVKSVANVVGPSLSDLDRAKNWDGGKQARHGGLINVLYYDGHVGVADEGSIDPVSKDIHDYWWMPTLRRQSYDPTLAFRPGIRAEYRVGMRWDGPPDIVRTEPDLNLPWGGGWEANFADMAKHPFYDLRRPGDTYYADIHTVIMRGQIMAPLSEDYTFRVSSDDECWFTIGGNEVVTVTGTWTGPPTNGGRLQKSMHFEAGRWYDFDIRFDNNQRRATHMWIKWSSPSTPEQMIPASSFRYRP